MLSVTYTAGLMGIDGYTVTVECNASYDQMSEFEIVGLPDAAVKEAKQRVQTAFINSGFFFPEMKMTVNLAPADVKKEGSAYDLAIFAALARIGGDIPEHVDLSTMCFIGELSFTGGVRGVRGVLPMVLSARDAGRTEIFVPAGNAPEAAVVDGVSVYAVSNVTELIDHLSGKEKIRPTQPDLVDFNKVYSGGVDFSDVKGQEKAKRAMEIAAAGGHNLLLIGPPGTGKSMISKRIPSILPPLTVEEALEVSRIHSVVGLEKGGGRFVTKRPFRAPHHTVSSIGLLGGGVHPVPGEVSLAHRGVLFLDEFAEFPRQALEVLRQPLEDGHVCVSRAAAAFDFPSKFMLVAAMNPCPCGYYNDPSHDCRCRPNAIMKYQSRVSGPLLDRIDIQIEVPSVPVKDLPTMDPGEPSAAIRNRVLKARAIQAERYAGMPGVHTNADVKSRDLAKVCHFTLRDKENLVRMIERLKLSARAYDKVLRVARTIADLAGSETVREEDLQNALCYRRMDEDEHSFWI